ncbi:MAG: hypothetical protein JWR24_4028 [Actinoallomurus sp.]|nr:hypothetical protein [Actinoallomurus sp.]
MALKREWRRVGAASATVSAGALVFFAAGTGPASAETRLNVQSSGDCKLGGLLCGILGGGKGKPATPPKPSGGQTGKPKSKPRPKSAPAHPEHGGSGSGSGSGSAPIRQPMAPPAADTGPAAAEVTSPQRTPPALPDITSQNPVVFPEAAPGEQPSQAHLVAATAPADGTMPPLLVATASGIIGAVAALNLSVLNRRLRRPRHR